jgi:hypothetical protein
MGFESTWGFTHHRGKHLSEWSVHRLAEDGEEANAAEATGNGRAAPDA